MKYYTVKEVAKKYNVCYKSVHKWIQKGWIKSELIFDEDLKMYKRIVSEKELERFEISRPCRNWKFGNLSSEIDTVARHNLEILYGIRDYIDDEIMKYTNVLSIINDEETF